MKYVYIESVNFIQSYSVNFDISGLWYIIEILPVIAITGMVFCAAGICYTQDY